MKESYPGFLDGQIWKLEDRRKVNNGTWKELNLWVYGYRIHNPDHPAWSVINKNPITEETIKKLFSEGWEVGCKNLPGGFCDGSSKQIILNEHMVGYERDAVLFHELVHAHYPRELDDSPISRIEHENRAITEWLARKLRAEFLLLRCAIQTFDIPYYIYDKVSYYAFNEDVLDLKKQFVFPFGKERKKVLTSVFMRNPRSTD